MTSLPCKFPRFSDKYVSLTRSGNTEDDARKNAELALAYKSIFSPLDQFFVVSKHESRGVPFFEATVFYLHQCFKDRLTELESRRLNGIVSKLLIVDDTDMLDKTVYVVKAVGIYDIHTCTDLANVVNAVVQESPDLLVLSHELKNSVGFDVLKRVRQDGIEQKTIVRGHTSDNEVYEKYSKYDDVWYYLHMPHDHQLRDWVEKALNGIKGRTLKDFYVF